MRRINAPLMLVGSVPLSSAEEALATCAGYIGGHVAALPDGETGYRTNWVNYQAYFVHHPNPMLETLVRPGSIDGVQQWSPAGLTDLWNFRVRPEVDAIEYGPLYYATEAAKSYVAFKDLKHDGAISADVRFQVSLPSPHAGICAFFRSDPADFARVLPGYQRSMAREVAALLEAIPNEELAIQWDICTEILEIEGGAPWMAQDGQAWERYLDTLRAVAPMVPEDVLVGLHLCYGDLGGHHLVQPKDLGLLTRMANTAVEIFDRTVDWLHMPVPVDRTDDEYFAPLQELEAPDSHLFLGLLHLSDEVPGARRRIEAAKRHTAVPFGVSTECGFGRRPADSVRPLLRLHCAIADELSAAASG